MGIARALALDPELIVCDEAVSTLDGSIQAQIINLLEEPRAKFGLTYLFIGHDLSVVRHFCDQLAVMYLGRIMETGTSDEVFSSPRHPYTKALIDSVPAPDPEGEDLRDHGELIGEFPNPLNPPSGCVFQTRCPIAMELVPKPGAVAQTAWRAPRGRLFCPQRQDPNDNMKPTREFPIISNNK